MKPKYWLVLGVASASGAQLAACSSNSHSCAETRTCAPSEAGAGGQGEGGETANGDAGNSDAGATGSVASSGPVLFGACSKLGDSACQYSASAQRLACDGTTWQPGTTCATGQLCDSMTGKCAEIIPECASGAPGQAVCRADTPLTCGPDLVTAKEGQRCAGLCDKGICQAPICGDKKVEPGEGCDDGGATTTGACVKCKFAACGDGFVAAGMEECDDGNTNPGDGCSAECNFEPIAVAAGWVSTCALSKGGSVKCWGDNSVGELGIDTNVSHGDGSALGGMGKDLHSVLLGADRTAKAISVGRNSACAVLDNGDLKCWGENLYGILGQGNSGEHTELGDQPGEMESLLPIKLGVGRTATSVSQGAFHTCALLDNGEAKCWGAGVFGELGLDDGLDYFSPQTVAINLGAKAAAINASNGDTTCALLVNGLSKCWGLADYGSLSVDSTLNKGAGPSSFGRVAIGDFSGEMALLPGLSLGAGLNAKQLAIGFLSACALLSNNTVKCWGSNVNGELGLTKGGTGFQAGNTPALLAALVSVDLGPGRTAKSIVAGSFHHCAILDNDSVKCWGLNSNGQLGLGDPDNRGDNPDEMGQKLDPVPLGHKAVQLTAGDAHTCALLDNGTIVCWGNNSNGQLGVNGTTPVGKTKGFALTPVDLAF